MLDTNVALDVLVFDDPAARPLLPALREGRLRWLATAAMREELVRVLGYPKVAARLERLGLSAGQVLARFDRHASLVEAPARAPVACGDADDQGFVDLAVGAGAVLLSKDRQVLALRKRLERLGVAARAAWAPAA